MTRARVSPASGKEWWMATGGRAAEGACAAGVGARSARPASANRVAAVRGCMGLRLPPSGDQRWPGGSSGHLVLVLSRSLPGLLFRRGGACAVDLLWPLVGVGHVGRQRHDEVH